MQCFDNGQAAPCVVLCNDILYNAADASFVTSSASFVQVTGSQLVVPNGTWSIHYSIEIRGLLPDANVVAARFFNFSASSQICVTTETLQDVVGGDQFVLHGGVYYLTTPFATGTDFRWYIERFSGAGSVECRRARIAVIKRCA